MAITKPAARNILKFWDHTRPGHLDWELRAFCNDKKASDDRCSFIWPPMGSYMEHDSECCPDEGFQTSHWDFIVACQGTRPAHDTKTREKHCLPLSPQGSTDGSIGLVIRNTMHRRQPGTLFGLMDMQTGLA